ncbi:MAG TPA: hypothetical protein VFS00_25345 [Polyangiaceae bacterium]|nr:hypothetical protein [Polyangiaceae bacterium]
MRPSRRGRPFGRLLLPFAAFPLAALPLLALACRGLPPAPPRPPDDVARVDALAGRTLTRVALGSCAEASARASSGRSPGRCPRPPSS